MLSDFSTNYRIYYADTDAGGVVYYANYLKFFEQARTDLLRSKNIIQSDLMNEFNIAFVVRKCEIDYLAPAKLDDLITVNCKIIEIGGASIKMAQEITKSSKILAKLTVKIACLDIKQSKPTKIPQNIIKLLNV